jgi:hypothetical protein
MTFRIVLSQNFSTLTKIIEKSINVYDTKQTYYKIDLIMNVMIFILYHKYIVCYNIISKLKKFDLEQS